MFTKTDISIYLMLCFSFFMAIGITAQVPEWESVIGSSEQQTTQYHDVVIDKQGSTTIVGVSGTNYELGKSFIRKYDENKTLIWEQIFPHTYIRDIDKDKEGNIYFSGDFTSNTLEIGNFIIRNTHQTANPDLVDFTLKRDVFLGKLNAITGSVEWVTSNESSATIEERIEGAFCIAGTHKTISSFPSMDGEVIEDLKCDTSGNVYLTGYFRSASIVFENQLAKNNWHADLLDQDNECNPDGEKEDCSLARLKTFFVAKFSQKNGEIQWVKSEEGEKVIPYETPNCGQHKFIHENKIGMSGTHLATDASGNVYVSFKYFGSFVQFGNTRLPIAENEAKTGIVKYSANGNVLWAKETPAGPLVYDNKNQELIAAYSAINETNTKHSLTKYNPANGKQFHTFIFPQNSGESKINTICIDDSSHIYLAGVFSNRLDFEQANKRNTEEESQTTKKDTFSLESTGHKTAMILKYDDNFDALWGINVDNKSLSGENKAHAIDVHEGKVVVAGTYGKGGQHYFGKELHLIGSEGLQGYFTQIDQQPMISVHFRKMTANAATMPTHFELWGQKDDGEGLVSKSFVIKAKEYDDDDPSKENARYGEFNPTLKELVDLKDLYILKDGKLLGKTTFKYNVKNACAGRKKDAYVILHDDLIRYKEHPIEKDNKRWKFKEKYKYNFIKAIGLQKEGESTNGGDFYQTTLFIPPGNKKKNGFILVDEKEADLLKGAPAIMIHGYTGADQYWGDDIDIIESDKADITGKSDYLYTSYTGRIQKALGEDYKVWEYVYPSDQSWLESSYLLGKSLEMMLKEFYTENTKAAIVAHSMGGLVTRGYIEGHAENYKKTSSGKTTFKYKENIKNVLFLGTPHHGAFSGNRLYWGIFLPDFIGGLIKDDYAPAARILGAGHEVFSRLNDRPVLNNHGVPYFQMSGTTYKGLIPGVEKFGKDAQLFTESHKNEDGAVAISSGNLLKFGVPLGLVNNFSHLHLNKPENEDNPLTEEQMQLIPTVAKEFIKNSAVQSTSLFRWYGTSNETMEEELGYPGSQDNIKLNIATPMITFNDMETGEIWRPRGGRPLRFKLEVQSFQGIEDPVAILKKEIVEDPLKYNAAGTYLYYGGNNLLWNKIRSKGDKFQKDNVKNEFSGFYPYRVGKGGPWNLLPDAINLTDLILYAKVLKPLKKAKDAYDVYDDYENAKPDRFFNPLSLNTKEFIQGKGLGWHLPNHQKLDLQVYFEFIIKRRPLDEPVRFFHDTNNLIKLERSQTTYNNIKVSKSARYLLNALQHLHHHYLDYIFDLTEGDFSTGGNLLADRGNPSFTAKSRSTSEKHNWIDCNTNSSSFVLEYGAQAEPTFQLVDPNGRVISAQDKEEETIFYFHNPALKIKVFSINEPIAGKWKVLVNGQKTFSNEDYNLSFPMDVENLNVTTIRDTTVAAYTHIFRDSIILQTTLEDLSVPIHGMSVLADAYSEYGTNETIEFKDDGVGADALAGDNLFTAIFYPDTTGTYTIVTDIIGQMNGCNFIRESAIDVVMLPAVEEEDTCADFSIESVVTTANDCGFPKFSAQVKGGLAPYQYQWTTDGENTGAIFVATADYIGTQTLTVTDSNLCVSQFTFEVNEITTKPIDANLKYSLTDSTITFTLENRVNVVSYKFHSTDIPNFIDLYTPMPLPAPGVYKLCMIIGNSCGEKVICLEEIVIEGTCEDLELNLSTHYGSPHVLWAQVTGGTPPYQYSSNATQSYGDGSFQIYCSAFKYYVDVIDAAGCTITDTIYHKGFYPEAEINYTIHDDTIYFRLDSMHSFGFGTGRMHTDIPGGFIDNRFKTALPPPGTYSVCREVANYCSERMICNNEIIIEEKEEEADCDNLSLDLAYIYSSNPTLIARAGGGTPPYVYTANLPQSTDNTFTIGCTKNSSPVVMVTDANGCTVTDTLFNVNTYPSGDIEYTISNDTIHFRLENQKNINFISHWSTDIPGGILPNTFASAALPPPGRYNIFVEAPGQCSDGGISRWIEIEEEEPSTPDCQNGIEQNIHLSTQAQIDKLEEYYGCSDCSKISGDLIINGADIVDLSGLSFLTGVDGDIFIENCPQLTSLEGLENLTKIGSVLKIKDMSALINLDGLNGAAIKTIGKNLVIRNNSQLIDISALKGLQTIKGHLLIGNNVRLSNLSGLENLTRIDKHVMIENHPSLSDCSVLCTVFYEGAVGNKIILRNNKGGCNNPTQVLKSCNLIPTNCSTKSSYTYRIEGHKVYFTAAISEDAKAVYLWKLETGTFHLSDAPTFSYVFPKSGTYSVNMKVIGSCVAGITKTIVIPETTVSENTLQLCSDGIDNDGDGLIDEEDTLDCACIRGDNITAGFDFTIADNTLSLKDISTGEIVDRKWMSPIAIVGGKINLPISGSFNICLEVSNDCGGMNQFCQTISTGSVCDEFSPPITAESRSSTKQETTTADLRQTLGTARPNPTTDRVVIDFDLPKASKVTLQLFSLSGQQSAIYLNKVPYSSGKHQQEISLSHLPNGMYLMQFRTADAIWTEKIVKVD